MTVLSDNAAFSQTIGRQDAPTESTSDVAVADYSTRIEKRDRIIPGGDKPAVLDYTFRGCYVLPFHGHDYAIYDESLCFVIAPLFGSYRRAAASFCLAASIWRNSSNRSVTCGFPARFRFSAGSFVRL